GIANTLLAATGISVGRSLCEIDMIKIASNLLDQARQGGPKILLPVDVVVAHECTAAARAWVQLVGQVATDEMILDIGPESIQMVGPIPQTAGTILWNGPVGVFEFDQFKHDDISNAS
ncbi:MAG: phosphoglycerate kinase, partial [Steroidobacteraceae bacterium]